MTLTLIVLTAIITALVTRRVVRANDRQDAILRDALRDCDICGEADCEEWTL